MIVSRNVFFLALALILVGPFYAVGIYWLARSSRATGIGWFVGHTLDLNGSISSHLVVKFKTGSDSVTFNAPTNWGFGVGDPIPVRYHQDDPSDARVDTLVGIWGQTLVDSLLPIGVLLVLFFTPNRFDPLIPWKSRVVIGKRPFIQIIPGPR